MMSRIRYCLPALLLLIMLSGCAGGPSPSRASFLLQQGAVDITTQPASKIDQNTEQQPILVLEPSRLALPLTHDGIVMQTDPNQIVVASHNRWAAPLAIQLDHGLYQLLDSNLPHFDVRRASEYNGMADYRLRVRIDRFQGDYRGLAVISGSWRLFDSKDQIVGRGQIEESEPLHDDGYNALVQALGRGWHEARKTLAQEIRRALLQSMPSQ